MTLSISWLTVGIYFCIVHVDQMFLGQMFFDQESWNLSNVLSVSVGGMETSEVIIGENFN